MKKIFALILAIVLSLSLCACGNKKSASIEAIKEKIAPIMAEYGVEEYDVQLSPSERYEVVCPNHVEISDREMCEMIIDLIALGDMEDMEEEGEKIRFSGWIRESTEDDSEYYYYVNEAQAELSDRPCAGLYHSKNHGRCVYEYD